MLPNLISTKEHNQSFQTEYLYILHALEAVRQARIDEIDVHLAGQYGDETGSFPSYCEGLCQEFLTKHRDVLQVYVIRKYCLMMDNIIEYARMYYPKLNSTPLSAEMRRAILAGLDRIFAPDKISDGLGLYPPSTGMNTDTVDADSLFDLIQSQFYALGREYKTDSYVTPENYWRRRAPVVNVQELTHYLKALPSSMETMLMWEYNSAPITPFTSGLDIDLIQRRFRYYAQLLLILTYLQIPSYLEPDSLDHMYLTFSKDRLYNGSREILNKYQHLAGQNINNIICTSGNILYNRSKDNLSDNPTDSLGWRYLILAEWAHHEI